MARPSLGTSKTERKQLMITSDELAQINDWRFRNRIETQSEAIRRLIKLGLKHSELEGTNA